MYTGTQFSIFMVNKPGVLAQILREFARVKINIVAVTIMDSAEHGVMRVIFEDVEAARQLLSQLNMPYNDTEVLCLTLANKSGALAAVAEKLAKSHINISYAYCTAGAGGGRTTGVIKVENIDKAIKVLQPPKTKKDKAPNLRRPRSSKKQGS